MNGELFDGGCVDSRCRLCFSSAYTCSGVDVVDAGGTCFVHFVMMCQNHRCHHFPLPFIPHVDQAYALPMLHRSFVTSQHSNFPFDVSSCGSVSRISLERREFAMISETVNLAQRLMSARKDRRLLSKTQVMPPSLKQVERLFRDRCWTCFVCPIHETATYTSTRTSAILHPV